MRWVVSAKAVVLDTHRSALLGLNDRGEWELPGGQPEAGESPDVAVRREVREEAGLDVAPIRLLRAWVLHPIPGAEVLIVSYGCSLLGGELSTSGEHQVMRFHPLPALAALTLPAGYREDILTWAGLQQE